MKTAQMYESAARGFFIRLLERLSGSKISRYLAFLERTQRFTRDELRQFQLEKLRHLLAHAYDRVPYYRRLMDHEGIHPNDFRSLEDLSKFPILTKQRIRESAGDIRATGASRPMKVLRAQTGGTTGEPLKFWRDEDCVSFTRAALLRSYIWTGYRIGAPMLFLTGGSLLGPPQNLKQRIGFWLMNYHFMPGFKLRSDTLEEYVRVIRQRRIRYLRGYTTLVHHFASLCEAAGIDDIELSAVYPTAEMLTKAMRHTIERVFHCKVYDHYGCAEINSLANECPEGRKLHVIEEHVIIEESKLNDLGDSALVITDLDNYAQPFIRYAVGDRGRLGASPCVCGRNLGVLEEFLGRSSDAIYLSTGERYPGVFFHHLFGHFEGVNQFQVVQHEAGKLLIKIIRNAHYSTGDSDQIKRLVQEHVDIVPEIEFCEEIPRSRSGKITSVICLVKENSP